MTNKQWILLVGASLFIAILAHAFFLYQWTQGVYMAGPNDGLSQMVPLRAMLYEQFTSGNFFYSFEFGLGGGTYTQLAYYYGINIFFFLITAVVFALESLSAIHAPDVLFWAQATVFISIIRLTLILMITTYVFRYMNMRLIPSFIGAIMYGVSAMYFRHVTFWEFFGDAFLWLPLLIFGVEKIIREKKPGWLIAATAISFFDNFYFAYINGFFTGLYIIARWLFPLNAKEIAKRIQIKYFSISVLLGFGIGSVGFIPAVWGFLQNVRPPYDAEIPILSSTSNILYDSAYVIVPAIFVLMLGLFFLYKKPQFRLFVVLSLFMLILHFIPWAASFFNGLSAPQQRFEYLATFTMGGAVAAGLPYLQKLKPKQVIQLGIWLAAVYALFYFADPTYEITSLASASFPILAALVLLLVYLQTKFGKLAWYGLLTVIVLSQLIIMNQYQFHKLYVDGGVHTTTKDYIVSDQYDSKEQQELMDRVLESDPSALSRVSWVTDSRNNTPIIQEFPGTSVYSSILNQHLLNFYYYDLEIDMKRESVSRYSGFGDRANLHSMWRGKYAMFEKGEEVNIPYGFEPYMDSENYIVYENTNVLPFVRTSDQIYSEAALENSHVLDREQAMLQGLVVKGSTSAAEDVPQNGNLIDQATVESVGGTYTDGRLLITEKEGGLDITIPEDAQDTDTEDYYVSFHLLNNVEDAPGFGLHVNEFQTSRKSRTSIYKTNVNDITIRIPKDETISIRLPKGDYTLTDLELYAEDYETLEQVHEESEDEQKPEITMDGNNITIENLQSDSHGYMAIPVPYEKGWQVEVNGEKRDIEQVNYAFLGTSIQPGDHTVEFTYMPPYFKTTLVVMAISLLVGVIWVRRA
ncbi:YfhO family protein [Virgibacillus sp. NKC19-16]|uniref:YfhO family protein n=1 Tax=Virgibacillus salidurans TaxID=2831673 RepID=UPI001F1F11B9|nr:YfhO family protein [Virgibacillus sp. NKC19-16]UJL46943.1 YfhO family protein [Virgibacillus sp. NKC19-16]